MQQGDNTPLSEATVRNAWQQLIVEDLPRVARLRGWPQRTPAEFERVLLDQVLESPCESGASRRTCAVNLILAIELAGRALQGKVCLRAMERRSQAMRDRQDGDEACERAGIGAPTSSAAQRLLAELAKPTASKPAKKQQRG
ncbi:MAG: hypothetical protein U1E34_13160 [Amaricoccus sp.]